MDGFKQLPAVFYRTGAGREPGRIARVLFCIEHGRMVLLHGFLKKTQRTPDRAIDVAMRRMKGGV